MRLHLLLPLVLLATVGCAHAPEAPQAARTTRPEAKPLTLPEMMRLMDASKVRYDVAASASFTTQDREAAAVQLWGNSDAAFPRVVRDGSGKVTLAPVEPPTGPAGSLFHDAEEAFRRHDFAEAETFYAKVLALEPDDYLSLSGWGECALYQQHYDEAVKRFTRAIAVNPWTHAAYAYRGEALLDMGKRDEAVRDYVRALARRPRWPLLLKEIEVRERALRVRLVPDRLLPAVRVSSTADGIKIETDSNEPAWLGLGVCKALWMGEETHRLEMTGVARHTGTSTEERECYAALLTSYLTLREKNQTPPDSGLDEALAITKDGMTDELLVYEVLSRMDGNIVALLPDAEVARLEAFIRKYVVVDSDAPAPVPTPSQDTPTAPLPDRRTGTTTARN